MIASLLAAALAMGLVSCTNETSPTASNPSPKPPTANPRMDAALVGSWFEVSPGRNETMEFSADSSARSVLDMLEDGKIYRHVFLGSWGVGAGKITVRTKSATRSVDGGAAADFKDFVPEYQCSYDKGGDSLVLTCDGQRYVYRKGVAPALVKPTVKEQVVGSWKALEMPFESTLEILAGGSYRQITRLPTATGTLKWTRVEGTWNIAGSTLVLDQVKMSESTNGTSWTVVTDFFPLKEEWPLTFPASNRMSLRADEGSFDYELL